MRAWLDRPALFPRDRLSVTGTVSTGRSWDATGTAGTRSWLSAGRELSGRTRAAAARRLATSRVDARPARPASTTGRVAGCGRWRWRRAGAGAAGPVAGGAPVSSTAAGASPCRRRRLRSPRPRRPGSLRPRQPRRPAPARRIRVTRGQKCPCRRCPAARAASPIAANAALLLNMTQRSLPQSSSARAVPMPSHAVVGRKVLTTLVMLSELVQVARPVLKSGRVSSPPVTHRRSCSAGRQRPATPVRSLQSNDRVVTMQRASRDRATLLLAYPAGLAVTPENGLHSPGGAWRRGPARLDRVNRHGPSVDAARSLALNARASATG